MSNWILTIEGIGAHHNNKPDVDIDLLAEELIKKLQASGQKINDASLHFGGKKEFSTDKNKRYSDPFPAPCCDPGFYKKTINILAESAAAQDRQTERMKKINEDRAGKLGFDQF